MNYFLNAGLVRDGQLKPSEYQIKFLTNLEITEQLVVKFSLAVAEMEFDTSLIQLCDIYGEQLLDISLRGQHLIVNELEFNAQIVVYEIAKVTLLITQNDITLIYNGVSQTIQAAFLFQNTKAQVILGDHFTGMIGDLQFLNEIQIDAEIKAHKKFINLQKIEGISTIDYKIPYTKPLKTLKELEAPISQLVIQPIQTLRQIKRKNSTQIIVCHDMAGGYKEDIWCFGNKIPQRSYRFYYMMHCDIFIYFSHNFITIPTVPYINVCHSFGTKCLGTIITEGDDNTLTEQLLNGNYIDKLVEICQHYKFDGYLLNIETKVDNPEKLIIFIKELKEKLNKIDAIVIYYDSVISTGELKWQSSLNELNYMFYEAANGMFTDYHWNLDKMKTTEENSKGNVFVGIDIFGRGQYEGGQENSYKAVKIIQNYNQSIAFFGQAWTYETTGSRAAFLQKDESFWQGRNVTKLFDKQRNSWVIDQNGGQGWEIIHEDGEEIATASYDWCVRSFTVDLRLANAVQQGTIQFSGRVRGTGPKYDDLYLLGIELYDKNFKCLGSIDSFNGKVQYHPLNVAKINRCQQNWLEHTLNIEYSEIVQYVKFVEMGRDTEFWAGHFGAQFTGEQLSLLSYSEEKDILKSIKPKVYYDLPIQTYFNDANGDCYIDGVKMKGVYNNLNDFDLSLAYPNDLQVTNQEAWNGSTCVKISRNMVPNQPYIIKLAKFAVNVNTLYISLNLKGVDKKLINTEIIIKYSDMKSVYKPQKSVVNNGWDIIQFQVEPKSETKSIYLQLTNITNQQITTDALLGGLTIYDDKYQDQIKALQVDFKDPSIYVKQIQLKQSITGKFDLYIQFDLKGIDSILKCIRIFNDKVWLGNMRSTYGFFSQIDFGGKELYIRAQIVLNNGHHMKVDSIVPVIIYQDQVIML